MSQPTQVHITLTSQKIVVPHGTATTVWYVQSGHTWCPAHAVTGAQVEAVDQRPGVVWQSQITLSVPVGSLLKSAESVPAPVEDKDPMSYLRQGRHVAQRRTREVLYRVGPQGQLIREAPSRPPP